MTFVGYERKKTIIIKEGKLLSACFTVARSMVLALLSLISSEVISKIPHLESVLETVNVELSVLGRDHSAL